MKFCQDGWPTRVYGTLKKYSALAPELAMEEGILMRANRIVIPADLQKETLEQLHTGHQGIRKCQRRAMQSVWWPGLSTQLEQIVRDCPECIKYQTQRAEPLQPTPLPNRPWKKVATDLFEWKKSTYLLIVDYYSRWIEICLLQSLTSPSVVQHTKSIFARHGIPDEVISDNGPQYASQQYTKFAEDYGFVHKTSSPYHPQGNGEAERAVKTIKSLFKKDGDPYLALLAYRSTPLEVGYTPSELLMGRKLKSTVPISESQLAPHIPEVETLKLRDDNVKTRQKNNFDSHHGSRNLPQLNPGDTVWVIDRKATGTVVREHSKRSYEVRTAEGNFRRNRRDLVFAPQMESMEDMESIPDIPETERDHDHVPTQDQVEPDTPEQGATPSPPRRTTRSSTGKSAPPPERLDPSWK